MPKPIIVALDDDPQVLNAVERDLRQHFRGSYRIVKISSGEQALDTLKQLKQRNDPVALFLVDQRMPLMTGTEFLLEARKIYPDARKVLLTAYADTEAAITSINTVGLDYYLMKPWDPPEQHLYPVLDDLLSDWLASVSLPYEGIRVVGQMWSAKSHVIKDFLARNQIPYQWLDVERDTRAKELVQTVSEDQRHFPLVFLPEGDLLAEPSTRMLAERIGLQTRAKQPFYDLIIVGAGPAGLAAAVYAGSEGLHTVMIEREAPGGQAGTSSRIENYLGFPQGLSGADLARRALSQAKKFGVEVLTTEEVTGIRVEDPYRFVRLADGDELSCHALLIATGVSTRQLDVPGADKYTGMGIYYGAANTEAASCRGEDVCVVGGANSAGQGALFLSMFARKVTMLVRGASLQQSMSRYLIDQIQATDNIDVCLRTEVVDVAGNDHLEAVTLVDVETGERRVAPTAALFVFIGARPHTDMVAGIVERDDTGYILTGRDLMADNRRPAGWYLNRDPFLLETSAPGIFAAGDVRYGSVKRVASAVGEGAISVHLVHQYLATV